MGKKFPYKEPSFKQPSARTICLHFIKKDLPIKKVHPPLPPHSHRVESHSNLVQDEGSRVPQMMAESWYKAVPQYSEMMHVDWS